MTARLSLALAIHNHQPVGNFGWVYEEAYRTAYLPFLEALERHPAIRMALHYTGPLVEWLRSERPAFLGRLVALVERGQVELMGGGWDEPILVALPERDRAGQLRRMGDELEALSGRRPAGAWLAERVWEPSLPVAFADAGYRWTIVDDVHFRAASIPADRAWGPYSTDDQGRRLDVFATDQRLRYSIPFADPDDLLEYLTAQAGPSDEAGQSDVNGVDGDGDARLATMGDDGEKFGSWPRTYDHCWGSGRWVDRFFDALEDARDWLSMTTPSDWLSEHAAIGRAYIPTASYIEMTEWALPPDESLAFAEALHRAVDAEAPEIRWLRGGFWRNYLARYREINDMHKAMLRTSAKVEAMPPGPQRTLATDHLYQGQSNDTYWHGVFGGVYITHLRLATWEHLIAAEDLADPVGEGPGRATLVDVDLDGRDEALLETASQIMVVDLAEGAGIGQWDLRAPRHALAAVMRRRPEASHARLLDAVGSGEPSAEEESAATTIHDLVVAKEEGLAERIAYDGYERRSALVHLLDPTERQDAYASADFVERGDFVEGAFEVLSITPSELHLRRDGSLESDGRRIPIRLDKTIRLGGGRLDPTVRVDAAIENAGNESASAVLGLEFALNLLGGGGNPQAYYRVGSKRSPHDGRGSVRGAASIGFGNDWLAVDANADVRPPAEIWWQPIETVSNSEGGFERNYQGSSLLFRWPLELAPGASMEVSVDFTFRCVRDRRMEEAPVIESALVGSA